MVTEEKQMEEVHCVSMRTLDFEKAFSAMQVLSMPLKLGQKMRVIIDYDPQETTTTFRYLIDNKEQQEKMKDQ